MEDTILFLVLIHLYVHVTILFNHFKWTLTFNGAKSYVIEYIIQWSCLILNMFSKYDIKYVINHYFIIKYMYISNKL